MRTKGICPIRMRMGRTRGELGSLTVELVVLTPVLFASHFYPGGYVTVTVACQVDLSGVSIPGIPSSTTVTASATAPIDPYRAIG